MTAASARGVVAAGHAITAETGARVLREGGNAVDAAVASMLAACSAEPLLTGLGAGGYMLVVGPGCEPVLLDFFVEAAGSERHGRAFAELVPIEVSFGDANQLFHVGPSSVGAYGLPAGVCTALERFGSLPLADLAAPAVQLAREGVALTRQQAYVVEILEGIVRSTPQCAALFAPGDRLLRAGDVFRNPDLAGTLERLATDGDEPFYRGDIAAATVERLEPSGGLLGARDLAGYEAIERAPVRARYRGREVLTNPPPSAGGTLIAYALALLDSEAGPPPPERLIATMEAAQGQRTPEFLEGLAEPGFLDRFMAARLGSTTHISVLDAAGWACSVTSSNGEGSGIVVPGTGIHLNNMLGEQDLNPLGFHRHPPGRRLPSMMAPTVVLAGGEPELTLGSGGSNRIRSAITQTIVNVVDRGMPVAEAVCAPRLHVEDGVVYAEPGADTAGLERREPGLARFRDLNLFFGGVQAVARDPRTGAFEGGGDPRRGGAVVVA